MVPLEVRAFTLLAICVLLLAAVLALQLLPRGGPSRAVMFVALAIVAVLAIVVIVDVHP
jgi:prolipoprotein diacylglyceryltransferase